MEARKLVDVAVDIRSGNFWGTYTYGVPGGLEGRILPGSIVIVPFGPRRVRGFVLRDAAEDPVAAVKDIVSVVEPSPALGPRMMELASAVSAEYCSPIQMALRAMLPPALGARSRRIVSLAPGAETVAESLNALTIAEAAVVGVLAADGEHTPEELAEAIGDSDVDRVLRTLRLRGLVRVDTVFQMPERGRVVWEASLRREVSEEEIRVMSASAPRRAELLRLLAAAGRPMPAAEAIRRSGAGQSSLKALEKAGLVRLERVRVEKPDGTRVEADSVAERVYGGKPLDGGESRAAEAVLRLMADGRRGVLLLGGGPASRTAVYSAVLEQAVQRGDAAIVLVPEIALTPRRRLELSSRFRGSVVLLHSGLSAGERFAHWKRIAEGRAGVVVGARSAVFAPVRRTAAIVVDDEHHEGFKQTESSPRYNARDVAFMRCGLDGGTVILGSATPSIESYHRALTGELGLVALEPGETCPRPVCAAVDMREEFRRGNRSLLSRRLQDEVRSALASGNRVVLFLNKRGFSSFILCRECGFSVRCPDCDVTYAYHRPGLLKCHYCGREERAPDVCPKCGGARVQPFGAGTQRVEEEVRRMFGNARVVRIDLDTASKRSSYDALVRAFSEGRANVLVCTQMALGDEALPAAAVVGVLSADLTLNLPDYRSAERTYQVLAQVTGIAAGPAGVAVVQSYDPGHYSVQAACAGDYDLFYRREIESRMESWYPPLCHLVNVTVSSPGEAVAKTLARDAARILQSGGGSAFQLLGPGPAPFSRLRGYSRWQMLLKGQSRRELASACREMSSAMERRVRAARSRLIIDVDPVSML